MNLSDDLHHLNFQKLLRALDVNDPLVTLFGQISQIVLETNDAVVRYGICVLLNAVLLGNLACVVLALSEGVAKIMRRKAMLIGERTGSSVAQRVGETSKPKFYLPAVCPAVRQNHQILVGRPLMAYEQE
ncbi:hypothetical protein [Mycobacterium sherrisii]|uniref:hypothetical protein n=1 Tax=Mycobacterium sherrisii TaxID=243061 RepID=UPI000A1500FB|nr:hypothetical protein [Mycobacterium sherrisii]MCV7028869.1 hypothetical protein [Mycobacterium sherrisii]ORW82375.1 hypothetical protein AWC25_02495 [Mycobacterium sherrisii]